MGEKNEKARISIVVIGDVDSGKSTLTGHLIYKLGGVDKSVFDKIEEEADEMGQRRAKYAWILDRLKAEREYGKTIDTTISKFETANYDCTVIDTPGHREYLKNMITGTSQADFALLIIDSECFNYHMPIGQIREHILLAHTLGVTQIICCCNKMDATTPNYSKSIFDEIDIYMRPCLMAIGFNEILFVPVSGFEGDNLTERSPNLDWYKGPTILEAIDQINKPKRLFQKKPLRLPISDVYNIGGLGTVAVGCVETGVMKPGMAVTFGPYVLTTKVESIERHNKPLLEALPGDIVGFNVKNVASKDLKRGYVASNSGDDPVMCAVSFTSQVILMSVPGEIRKGYEAMLDCHTCHMTVKFDELLSKIDRISYEVLDPKPKFLKNGDAGVVKMVPRKPVVVETLEDYPPLGRFVLRDPRQTVGVGVVKSVEKVVMMPKVEEPKGEKVGEPKGEKVGEPEGMKMKKRKARKGKKAKSLPSWALLSSDTN